MNKLQRSRNQPTTHNNNKPHDPKFFFCFPDFLLFGVSERERVCVLFFDLGGGVLYARFLEGSILNEGKKFVQQERGD